MSYYVFSYFQEFELRKHARTEGRRYCDPVILTHQAERMPEQIRLKVGGVTSQQIAVYEESDPALPPVVNKPVPVRGAN
jgi:CCR4-NOT transcription complex subunit 1